MRNQGVIVTLTIIISALCLYYLSFTMVSRRINEQATTAATTADGTVVLAKRQQYLDSIWNKSVYNLFGKEFTYKEVKENELSLGLDLQGGMHVVLEVSQADVILGLAGNRANDQKLRDVVRTAQLHARQSQDNFTDIFYEEFSKAFQGEKLANYFASAATKDRISPTDADEKVLGYLKEEIENAVDRSFTILKTRIDQFGTSQPNIQRIQGTGTIQIEIPGADNPERVRKLLQGVAKLEFWRVVEPDDATLGQSLTAINRLLLTESTVNQSPGKIIPDSVASDTTLTDLEKQLQSTPDSATLESLNNAGISPLFRFSSPELPFYYNVRDTGEVNRILRRDDVKKLLPRSVGFFWDVKPDPGITPNVDDLHLNFIDLGRSGRALLDGNVITDARLDYDQYARPAVTMNMNSTGARAWAKITAAAAATSPQSRIAIVLDNFVYTAPTVQGEIPNGNSQITGSFELEEAKDLANVLKAGSLPAPTRIVEEAIVGPSLGKTAQSQGLISMACGLAIVVLFMVAYYAKGGIVANVALLFNMFFILGILAQFNAALTLPGIAGIVLTMGMAVDANVLIFERIREERRNGRQLREAITRGYQRAFASILDSNLTTFLTAAFLFFLGQGPLKGFAITLMIGITTSFFSAVYISRVVIQWIVGSKPDASVSFDTALSRRFAGRRNIDFIGKRKITYIISSVIIITGFVLIIFNGMNLGVDFKGGRSFVVSFNKPVVATDMRNALFRHFEDQGTEVKNYGSNNVVKVTTAYLIDEDADEANDRVKNALIAGLQEFTGLTYSTQDEPQANTFTISSSSKVGASVADDIKNSALNASLLSLLGIFFYLLIRFRKWQYSVGAIVSTVHDALFVIAAFAVVALFGLNFEVDQVFVAALLTIIGYSINDTVIIYDRIREHQTMGTSHDKVKMINEALNITFSRTLITSGTTLFVVVVLLLFGGEVLRGFSFALLVGIVIGTYSSIFIAAPLLLDLDKTGSSVATEPGSSRHPEVKAPKHA